MAPVLAQEEPKEGTYLELYPMLEHLIRLRLRPGEYEGETSRIWIYIITAALPGTDGFFVGPEMICGDSKADLFIGHSTFDARFQENRFFIVECKAPALESQPSIWVSGYEQLESYLKHIRFSSNRKFGAIAVGKAVQFYELKKDGLVDLEGDGSIYFIDRHCQTITAKLHFVRDNYHL